MNVAVIGCGSWGKNLGRNVHRLGALAMVCDATPTIVRLQELVWSEDLGKIQYIYSNRLSLGKVRREENMLWSFAPHDVALILGSRKMATFDDVAKQLTLYDQRVDVQEGESVPVRGSGEAIMFPDDEPLRLECQAFLDAMPTRQPPITDGYSGLRVLGV